MKHDFYYQSGDIELRPMTYEDSQKYRLLRNQEQNRLCFFSQGVLSAEDQRNWYEKYEKDDTDIMFAFYYRNVFAGGNAIYHIDRKKGCAEYGRLLVDKINFPEKGLGSAITYGASEIACKDLGLTMLYSEIRDGNLPSLYAHLKVGFHEVETCMLNEHQKIYYLEKTFEQIRKEI